MGNFFIYGVPEITESLRVDASDMRYRPLYFFTLHEIAKFPI